MYRSMNDRYTDILPKKLERHGSRVRYWLGEKSPLHSCSLPVSFPTVSLSKTIWFWRLQMSLFFLIYHYPAQLPALIPAALYIETVLCSSHSRLRSADTFPLEHCDSENHKLTSYADNRITKAKRAIQIYHSQLILFPCQVKNWSIGFNIKGCEHKTGLHLSSETVIHQPLVSIEQNIKFHAQVYSVYCDPIYRKTWKICQN